MDPYNRIAQLRQAASDRVSRPAIRHGGILDDLAGGFEFSGGRIQLINPQRGILKPRQMDHLSSIKTVFPRKGARVWYDDQRFHRTVRASRCALWALPQHVARCYGHHMQHLLMALRSCLNPGLRRGRL